MTAHKHAALLAEWIKDTSRVILGRKVDHYHELSRRWHAVAPDEVVRHEDWEYRFGDIVKPEVTSPLSDDELSEVWSEGEDKYSDHDEQLRAIAIAAKIATILEIAAMSFDTSLLECNGGGFSAAAMGQFAGACVAEFQRKLLAGISECKHIAGHSEW